MDDFQIGPWRVEPHRLTLTQGHGSVSVKPRSMAVLVALAKARGAVVARRELMQQVWGDAEVTDDVLTQSIVELRRALGDNARRPRYIETIKRVGFRLMPEQSAPRSVVRPWIAAALLLVIAAVAGAVVWRVAQPMHVAAPDRSLALVPFSIVGADAGALTFAEALTQELASAVTGHRGLRVVSTGDATDSDAVDATYVLSGNVQRLDRTLHVRAQLIRANDRETVWAKTFVRRFVVGMAEPAEVASTVGRFVRVQIDFDRACEAVRRTSASRAAANAYCAALDEQLRFSQIGDRDPHVVLHDAERALALDPGIVDAYRLVADAYTSLGSRGLLDWRAAARGAHAAIDRGLALAPNDPRLEWQLTNVKSSLELDYRAAEAVAHPSSWSHFSLGRVELARGNVREALEEFHLALRLNDASAGVYLFYAAALWCAGENRQAIDATSAGSRLVQGGELRVRLLSIQAMAHAALGETAAANAVLDDALAGGGGPTAKMLLAGALARAGRTDEARQLLTQLEAQDRPPLDAIVWGYAALGDERAFEWVHRAIDAHVAGVVGTLRTDPLYAPLRDDPRWHEVIAHLASEEAKARGTVVEPDRLRVVDSPAPVVKS